MQRLLVLGVLVLLSCTLTFAANHFPIYSPGCFFTLGQDDDGVYWFVDPNGNPYFFQGIDSVTPAGDQAQDGSTEYKQAVNARWGGDYYAWANYSAYQMVSWGFNGVGPFSSGYMFNQSLPYTVMLQFIKNWDATSGNTYLFPDIFDPGFVTSITSTLIYASAPYVNDPYLVGYFLDNELFFGNDFRADYSLMAMYLNQSGYGYTTAVNFLSERYDNNITMLNIAWGVDAISFATLSKLWPYPQNNKNFQNDYTDFQNMTVHFYFNLTTSMLRATDPNHLVLGIKYAGYVYLFDGQYGNVTSYDNYEIAQNPKNILPYFQGTGLPVLIGEFSFKANDSGLPNTVGSGIDGNRIIPPNQTVRANDFAVYVKNASVSPYLVGLSWFEWGDEPASGTSTGENSNFGVVNASDDVYVILTGMMAKTYPLLYGLHGNVSKAHFTPRCGVAIVCPTNCRGNGCCLNGVCHCDSVHSGIDCNVYNGSFVDTFQTFNATQWNYLYGYVSGAQYVSKNNSQITGEGIEIAVSVAGCPSACGGASASTGGFSSQVSYGYGTLAITMKMTNNVDESFIIQSGGNLGGLPWNYYSLNLVANGLNSKAGFSSWQNGVGGYFDSVKLPYDPSSDFHTITIERANNGSYFAILADSTLLYNTTQAPIGPAAVSFNYFTSTLPSNLTGLHVIINSINYTIAPTIKAVCNTPPSTSSSTSISSSVSSSVSSSASSSKSVSGTASTSSSSSSVPGSGASSSTVSGSASTTQTTATTLPTKTSTSNNPSSTNLATTSSFSSAPTCIAFSILSVILLLCVVLF